MKLNRVGMLGLLTAALLSACGGGDTSSTSAGSGTLRVSSVLPDLLTPGDTATVYGSLPAGTTAQLDGAALTSVPMAGGLRLTLPAELLAGTHSLTLMAGGQRLQVPLVVRPRLDGLALDGQTLRLSGAGWQAGTTALQVELLQAGLATQRLTPAVPDAHALSLTLARSAAYGPAQVRVLIGGQESAALPFTREAGSVQGKLSLPASTAAPGGVSLPLAAQAVQLPSRALLVILNSGQLLPTDLKGVTRQDGEAALNAVRLEFATLSQATSALEQLRSSPAVQSVTFDRPLRLDGTEHVQAAAPRADLMRQDASSFTPSPDQWHLGLLGLQAAWARTTGTGVTVAVVDTGILARHPDFAGRVLPGYNFVDDTTDTTDTYGHGTHVAGLIGAAGRALGVAPGVSLLPVRVIRDQGGGSALDVARGVLYAVNLLPDRPNPHPAQVINLSLGLDGGSPLIEQSVTRAMAAGALVVVAAGNTGGALASPASVPGVISVSAIAGPALAYVPAYSNWGENLQVASYGGDLGQDQNHDGTPDGLLSTDLNNDGTPGYSLRNGTSMAAPLVSGMAALALANGTPAPLVAGLLKSTATDLYVSGYDLRTGSGLPTGRAVTLAAPRSYVLALDAQGKLLGWTAVQPDGSFLLGNLPPGEVVSVFAASDANNDGVVGQVGEQRSDVLPLTVRPASVQDLQLSPLRTITTAQPLSLTLP